MRGYSPCGKRYAAMLFRGLCLGQTGHAGNRFYCAALAQKVDALKAFQYAALFGRRGASAFETAVLGHKYSPSYKINIKSVIKRRLFQIATFFLPLTNLFYAQKIDCRNIYLACSDCLNPLKYDFQRVCLKKAAMFAGIQTLIGLILRYRVRILYICFLTVPSWGADWRMLAIEYRIFIYLFFGGHAFQRGLPPCGELILPRHFKEKKPKLQKSPIKKNILATY